MGGVEERESSLHQQRERERESSLHQKRERESSLHQERESSLHQEREREREPGKVTGRVGPDGVYFPVSASATAWAYRPAVWRWMSTTVNLDTVFSV